MHAQRKKHINLKEQTYQTERIDTMKKLLLMIVVVMMATVGVKGQESLAGRVYYCGNMMMKEMGDLKKDAKQLEKEAETEEEKKEAKGLTAITNAVVSKMTIKFISDKTVELMRKHTSMSRRRKKAEPRGCCVRWSS